MEGTTRQVLGKEETKLIFRNYVKQIGEDCLIALEDDDYNLPMMQFVFSQGVADKQLTMHAMLQTVKKMGYEKEYAEEVERATADVGFDVDKIGNRVTDLIRKGESLDTILDTLKKEFMPNATH